MDATNAGHLRGLSRCLKVIAAEVPPDFTLRQLLVLLAAGSKAETTQSEIVEELDLYKSLVSRTVAALSGEEGDVRRDGLGLLRVDLDPKNFRSRVISLTKAGDRLLTRAAKEAFGR